MWIQYDLSSGLGDSNKKVYMSSPFMAFVCLSLAISSFIMEDVLGAFRLYPGCYILDDTKLH